MSKVKNTYLNSFYVKASVRGDENLTWFNKIVFSVIDGLCDKELDKIIRLTNKELSIELDMPIDTVKKNIAKLESKGYLVLKNKTSYKRTIQVKESALMQEETAFKNFIAYIRANYQGKLLPAIHDPLDGKKLLLSITKTTVKKKQILYHFDRVEKYIYPKKAMRYWKLLYEDRKELKLDEDTRELELEQKELQEVKDKFIDKAFKDVGVNRLYFKDIEVIGNHIYLAKMEHDETYLFEYKDGKMFEPNFE